MSTEPRSGPALTELLLSWKRGEGAAFKQVIDQVYAQLKQIAAQRLHQSGSDLTLTPTDLLHDAVLRVAEAPMDWKNRAHFFASMSLFIRSALVDHARARQAAKRGGRPVYVTLSQADAGEASMAADLLALDQALLRLEALDPRGAQVLHLAHFGGLDRQQIAAVLEVSLATVDRDLRFTRAWLREELANGE
ncbi:ECF-type sigma factor [Tahibacter harae]|uniref:ECF-type sigma factor n=1 Tax=Tahibacter harae TaxID=2963937 RepID=A0ABT1QYD9_9GAMM|nr:ECF-type sigma factor [Tahibacter harae]MCQ4167297.1 ECF-type sigma factor [Tahibacter harae]